MDFLNNLGNFSMIVIGFFIFIFIETLCAIFSIQRSERELKEINKKLEYLCQAKEFELQEKNK